jgi:hypothetical protein
MLHLHTEKQITHSIWRRKTPSLPTQDTSAAKNPEHSTKDAILSQAPEEWKHLLPTRNLAPSDELQLIIHFIESLAYGLSFRTYRS